MRTDPNLKCQLHHLASISQSSKEAPRLKQLFDPDAFVHQKGFLFVKDHVSVTVRFIKEIEPVYHLREFFRAPASGCSSLNRYRLLHFPHR
eukprot:symbB.v1.2.024937.t1/scaffold2396.1/size80221/3